MNTLAKHFSLGGLLRFAAPAVGMMLVISIYTVTDGIFIGRYAGSLALAASNLVYPALNLVAYALALGGFGLFSWSFLLCGFNLFSSTFFTAVSDGRMSAILSFVRNLVGIVVFLVLLPRFFGLDCAWLAVPAADAAAVLLSFRQLWGAARSFREEKAAAL